MREKYNGFENRETWLVCLWLDNEEHLHRAARFKAKLGATRFEQFVYAMADETKISGTVFADFVSDALGEVNWDECVEHFTAED